MKTNLVAKILGASSLLALAAPGQTAIVIGPSPAALVSASASLLATSGDTRIIDVIDARSFDPTAVPLATAVATSSVGDTTGFASPIFSAQFAVSNPDSDHFSLQLLATGSALITGTCGSNCSGLSATAFGTAEAAFGFSLDSPHAFTISYSFPTGAPLVTSTGDDDDIAVGVVQAFLRDDNSSEVARVFASVSTLSTNTSPDSIISGVLDPGTYFFTTLMTAQGTMFLPQGASAGLNASVDGRVDFELAPVPLPAAAWLLISGIAGLGMIGRRRSDCLSASSSVSG